MGQLDKADLEQMTDDYLQSLEPERLVAGASHFCRYMKMLDDSIRFADFPRSIFTKVGCSP
jgi:hypothetical protein